MEGWRPIREEEKKRRGRKGGRLRRIAGKVQIRGESEKTVSLGKQAVGGRAKRKRGMQLKKEKNYVIEL